jgi:hypothetical protein
MNKGRGRNKGIAIRARVGNAKGCAALGNQSINGKQRGNFIQG